MNLPRTRGQCAAKNSIRHAAVCINIEKSMVTRDVDVPPQQQPMDAHVRPYHYRHDLRDPREIHARVRADRRAYFVADCRIVRT